MADITTLFFAIKRTTKSLLENISYGTYNAFRTRNTYFFKIQSLCCKNYTTPQIYNIRKSVKLVDSLYGTMQYIPCVRYFLCHIN